MGKTRAAVVAIAADICRRRSEGDRSGALYLTPTLALADEVAELFRSEGVKARTFRGRNAPDPEAPDTAQAMCLDLEAVGAAVALGLAVGKHCCKGEHPKTGTKVFCPLFNHCAYQGQFSTAPDVWVGSHRLLFESHAGLGEIGSVTVDEGFWAGRPQDREARADAGRAGRRPALLQQLRADGGGRRRGVAIEAGGRGPAAGRDGRGGAPPPRRRRPRRRDVREGLRGGMGPEGEGPPMAGDEQGGPAEGDRRRGDRGAHRRVHGGVEGRAGAAGTGR